MQIWSKARDKDRNKTEYVWLFECNHLWLSSNSGGLNKSQGKETFNVKIRILTTWIKSCVLLVLIFVVLLLVSENVEMLSTLAPRLLAVTARGKDDMYSYW